VIVAAGDRGGCTHRRVCGHQQTAPRLTLYDAAGQPLGQGRQEQSRFEERGGRKSGEKKRGIDTVRTAAFDFAHDRWIRMPPNRRQPPNASTCPCAYPTHSGQPVSLPYAIFFCFVGSAPRVAAAWCWPTDSRPAAHVVWVRRANRGDRARPQPPSAVRPCQSADHASGRRGVAALRRLGGQRPRANRERPAVERRADDGALDPWPRVRWARTCRPATTPPRRTTCTPTYGADVAQ